MLINKWYLKQRGATCNSSPSPDCHAKEKIIVVRAQRRTPFNTFLGAASITRIGDLCLVRE